MVIEATGNAATVAELRAPHVDRAVIANPKQDWGRREGMKSVRECVAGIDVDLATLLWTHGRDYPLTRLEGRLKCPRCGSRRVVVMFQPPSNTGRRLRAAG